MIDTNKAKKMLADALTKYIKEKHTQEECVGFIDGFNEIKRALTIPDVVFSEAELKAKLEEQKEEIRQWLIGMDFEGLAESL